MKSNHTSDNIAMVREMDMNEDDDKELKIEKIQLNFLDSIMNLIRERYETNPKMNGFIANFPRWAVLS